MANSNKNTRLHCPFSFVKILQFHSFSLLWNQRCQLHYHCESSDVLIANRFVCQRLWIKHGCLMSSNFIQKLACLRVYPTKGQWILITDAEVTSWSCLSSVCLVDLLFNLFYQLYLVCPFYSLLCPIFPTTLFRLLFTVRVFVSLPSLLDPLKNAAANGEIFNSVLLLLNWRIAWYITYLIVNNN